MQRKHTVPRIAVVLHFFYADRGVGYGDFRLLLRWCVLPDFLYLGSLLLFLCLLQLCDMFINAVDDFRCGAADCFKRAFQFGKLPSGTPPGNVPKGIVRSIKPVMLAHGIGDTFCLYFTGAAVGSVLQVLQRGVKVNVVQLRMGDFMDSPA